MWFVFSPLEKVSLEELCYMHLAKALGSMLVCGGTVGQYLLLGTREAALLSSSPRSHPTLPFPQS